MKWFELLGRVCEIVLSFVRRTMGHSPDIWRFCRTFHQRADSRSSSRWTFCLARVYPFADFAYSDWEMTGPNDLCMIEMFSPGFGTGPTFGIWHNVHWYFIHISFINVFLNLRHLRNVLLSSVVYIETSILVKHMIIRWGPYQAIINISCA